MTTAGPPGALDPSVRRESGNEPIQPPHSEWARLHPLTPLLRGWRIFIAALVIVGQDGLRRGKFSGAGTGIVLVILVPIALVVAYLSWLRLRWRIEGQDVRIDSGVLTRRSRRVPLARLQAIDVVRPLVARVLGLAELRLEVVGHGRSEAGLAYLGEPQALAIRAQLLDLARRSQQDHDQPVLRPDQAAPEGEAAAPPPGPSLAAEPERLVLSVPAGRLVAALLTSAIGVSAVVVLLALIGAAVFRPAILGVAGAVVLSVGASAYYRFTTEFGFTVALIPDGLRLHHGLLDTRTQTVPRGRVQAVRLVEPLLWRRFGWARVEVDVAGYRHGARGAEQRVTTGVLVPVAPRAEAERVIEDVLPGLDLALPRTRPRRRARWRAPLSWHFLSWGYDERWIVTSFGRLTRLTDVVPQEKVQSLRLVDGPLQRALGLATLHVDTAGRNVHSALRQSDAEAARRVLDELTLLARRARRPQTQRR